MSNHALSRLLLTSALLLYQHIFCHTPDCCSRLSFLFLLRRMVKSFHMRMLSLDWRKIQWNMKLVLVLVVASEKFLCSQSRRRHQSIKRASNGCKTSCGTRNLLLRGMYTFGMIENDTLINDMSCIRLKIVAYQILNDIPQAKRDGHSVRIACYHSMSYILILNLIDDQCCATSLANGCKQVRECCT